MCCAFAYEALHGLGLGLPLRHCRQQDHQHTHTRLSRHLLSDDKFRKHFLWGRRPMLAACAARLQGQSNMVWVDLGGGTGVRGRGGWGEDCRE